MIRDHIAAHLGIEPADFEYAPFAEEGRLGKLYQLFGNELNTLIEHKSQNTFLEQSREILADAR